MSSPEHRGATTPMQQRPSRASSGSRSPPRGSSSQSPARSSQSPASSSNSNSNSNCGTGAAAASRFKFSVNAPAFVPNLNARPFFPGGSAPATASASASASASAAPSSTAANDVPSLAGLSLDDADSQAPRVTTLQSSTVAAPAAPSGAVEKNKPAAPSAPVVDSADEKINQSLIDNYFATQKERLSVVFIGHVDAGKSTMGGNILYLTGMVDQRTMEKYMRDARDAGRESWYLSWALDTNDEERARGKTVETGRAYFETATRKYTILDAPGHKNYVPSMIQGASQADVAILVISARRGEFETGFEGGGQTREHALLVKTAGIKRLIVVINKMDDPTVCWSEERYNECKDKLIPFLRKDCKYNIKTDVTFVPVSGFSGANLLKRVSSDVCPFYDGPSLLEVLDAVPIDHSCATANAPLIIPISDKLNDMGIIANGKVESGIVRKGMQVMIVPGKIKAEVVQISNDTSDLEAAQAGDSVAIKLRGIREEDICTGSVICHMNLVLPSVTLFDAQLFIIATERIITAGYQAVMHVHNIVEEVTIAQLLHNVCKKTGKRSLKAPCFATTGSMVIARIELPHAICLDLFKNHPTLGRFTLRLNTLTVAMGKVLKVFQE